MQDNCSKVNGPLGVDYGVDIANCLLVAGHTTSTFLTWC